ncbi:MAG: glycosyltransferase family 1 protein [Cereibacter sphaeroides]|uniref:Glycosyltransferase family 1 protein n=1 Tax=Cereibacter sphaeroides TaxID=1063 RepID=A0A2W5UIQ0_CERSP|nr:MAG: glycosyltransferase family 1 protein [Cereibacter sphaeroides]
MTGVDRVELAYLRQLLSLPQPCFGLVRTVPGVLLLDRRAMAFLRDAAESPTGLPPPDLWSRMMRRDPAVAAAEAALRKLAIARAPVALSAMMLRRRLPKGSCYLNVGHSNLGPRMFAAIRRGLRGQIGVVVHDTIPLDHPELCRPGTSQRFGQKMRAVAQAADLAIFTTQDALSRAEPHFTRFGRMPPALVSPIGIASAPLDQPLPEGASDRPFFLAVGTIESRKNITLLLDVWQQMHATRAADDVPALVIAGGRGWMDDAMAKRLDRAADAGMVVELPNLSDAAIAALMRRAVALLAPSLAEGFGLPGIEAAALGCPVICSDLPVFREVLKDYPVYLPPHDRYAWLETITTAFAAGNQPGQARQGQKAPTWDDHFKAVLNLL